MTAKRNPELTEVISIGQLNAEGEELVEIYSMYVHPGTFDRIKRMAIAIEDHGTPGCCWLDKHDLDGDLVDDPIAVMDFHAQWLLKEFFKVPQKYWKRVDMSIRQKTEAESEEEE